MMDYDFKLSQNIIIIIIIIIIWSSLSELLQIERHLNIIIFLFLSKTMISS
jgi:hypothetical protein